MPAVESTVSADDAAQALTDALNAE
jgi:hypothetical protein